MPSNAERSRAYRDRKRGGPPRTPAPCGTPAAYRRHVNAGEDACDACRAAWAEYHQNRRKDKR